ADAGGSDLGAVFFGEAAGKGLSLVDLVARRYDVVAANPPYMGSRNMGAVLKRHIEQHFRPGKRDISAAFILRCLELAAPNGRVAMVAQQSWMFLRSYADLRALDDVKRKKSPRAFRGVLKVTSLEVVAHLGEHAFHDSSAAGAFVAMFVAARTEPAAEHRLTALRLVGPKNPEEKDRLLQRAVRRSPAQTLAQSDPKTDTRALHAVVSQPLQARFLTIPQAPLCYWLREGALAALNQAAPPGFELVVSEGLGTRRDERFVRFVWEVTDHDRWWVYSKGGGYGRWFGHDMWSVDWAQSGARVRSYISEHYPPEKFTLLVRNESRFGTARLVYSTAARGSLGAREIDGAIPGDKGPGLFLKGASQSAVLALLNCRGSSYLLRGLTAGGINFNGFYVGSLPVWLATNQNLEEGAATCVSLVRWMVSRDPTERSFGNALSSGGLSADVTLQARFICAVKAKDAVAATLHEAEGQCEQRAFAAYGIANGDLEAILEETGTPAGWFPLIAGYDAAPELPHALKARLDLESFSQRKRRWLSASELSDLKRRLRALYEGGSGAKDEEEEPADEEEGDKDESEAATCGARMPIPAATFLEELSQKLEIHPVSVYCLLRELRENEGVVCKPELVNFDSDGVIPLTEGAGEATLICRLRERLAEEFGGGHVAAVEREFEEIIGKPLGTWLASDFFKRHASRFRKRPIVWQLTSRPAGAESPRGRGAVRPAIPFACLIYYHRLDGDTVPKLRSQYIGPLRTRLQTEFVGLENLKQRTPDQDARRVEVDADIEALRAFDARLEEVIVSGFDSDDLEAILVEEPLNQWTSRDGRAVAPASRDAFRFQERRYEPDLNDGVRVNIAPLQRAGLLAADVLATKDVEKAIADRAEWRSDERRWCREGKLTQPGWWPARVHALKG
ncbi:MAG: N-6 DNA methylase, partial [Polyangiaceae bacterium]